MASLTLQIGPITAAVTANDAKASAVLNAFADAIGATGSNQQRAEAVVTALVRYMVEVADGERINAHRRRAEATAAAETRLRWD